VASLLVALVEGSQQLLEDTRSLQKLVSALLHDFREGSHGVGDDLVFIDGMRNEKREKHTRKKEKDNTMGLESATMPARSSRNPFISAKLGLMS